MTILGLLLVVSFVANYLGTTLPRQMTVNDVNHELQVENQLGHLGALMQAASQKDLRGVPIVQPVSLGSEGVAPFAAPDGGVLTGLPSERHPTLRLGLFGTNYHLPSLSPTPPIQGCSVKYTTGPEGVSVHCSNTKNVTFNYLNESTDYHFKFSGEGNSTVTLGYETNNSRIHVSTPGAGGGFETVMLIGNNNLIEIQGTGGSNQKIVVYGSNNIVYINATSNQTVTMNVTGDGNNLTVNNTPGSTTVVYASAMGEYTQFTAGKGGTYSVTYTGFDFVTHPSPFCPYGNIANSNNVTNLTEKQARNKNLVANVTYNDTNLSGLANLTPDMVTHWNTFYQYHPTTCNGFAHFRARLLASHEASSVVVRLGNRYAPAAEIALDQGAVIYAQQGGVPFMVDPPPISYSPGYFAVWLPAFYNDVPVRSGTGTAVVTFQQLLSQHYTFPGGGWLVDPGQDLILTYHTPYYVAWMNYFCGPSSPFGPYASLSLDNATGASWSGPWGCDQAATPWNFTQLYEPNGPMGTITLKLPVSIGAVVDVRLAIFSIPRVS